MATQGGIRKKSGILLIQSEATPGVDPGSWAVATHGVVAYEITFNPLDALQVFERAPMGGPTFIARQTSIPGVRSSRLTCRVPLVGSGNTASPATMLPDWEPLALACNLLRDAPNDVTGPPATRAFALGAAGTTMAAKLFVGPAADMGGVGSDWMEYLSLGMAGTFKIVGGTGGDPATIEFDLQGSYVEPVALTDPSSGFVLVEVCPPSFLNIGCTWFPDGLAAHTPVVKTFEFDGGNTVAQRTDLNATSGIVSFLVTDQSPKVTMQISEEAVTATVPNPYKDATDCARFGILEVGKVGAGGDGTSFQLNFNRANVEAVGAADADGIMANDLTFTVGQDLADLATPGFQLLLD
jgi:hypothetical protein